MRDCLFLQVTMASPVTQMIKNPPGFFDLYLEDLDSIPRLGRFPGRGHGNSLQYSCLENSMDREEKLGRLQFMGSQRDMTEQLSTAQVITSQE